MTRPASTELGQAAVGAHFDDVLNPSDALLWTIERDPSLRTTIVAIAVLDRAPDWARLQQRLVDASIRTKLNALTNLMKGA